jgi:translocation and assembly module TamA
MLSIYQVVNSGRVRLLILLLCWLPSWVSAQQVVVNMEGDYPELKSEAPAI